ncbi:MAG: MOSC N-terminal beta barrel domain-containing protein [Bacteroidia bacterium]|nr:MOSC N-terminal beta barrel domain-containing protein [Bacteroidia bacterium]
MLAPTITSIHIYPIKSMGGISLTEAEVGMRGLQHDRRYMLVSEEGRFLTQRQTPELGRFHLQYNTDQTGFLVTFQGDTLAIPLSLDHQNHQTQIANVWDDTVEVLSAPSHINQWFSQKLQRDVSLVYQPDNASRPVAPEYQPNPQSTHHVSLADGYPILVVSAASLSLLNQQIQHNNPLAEPMEMSRFRPNIVVDNLQPHQEDSLGTFELNSTTLHITKPCSRCILTTIDPITLERGDEPLRTLSTYRKENNKILFGANALCLKPGKIRISS